MLCGLGGLSKMLVRRGAFRFARGKRRLQKRKLVIGLQSPEALGGLLHGAARAAPSKASASTSHYTDAPHSPDT